MKIDFYILENASKSQALLFTCKLVEQAHSQQEKVYLHTHSREEAEQLDKLLWIYREDSFLPHALYQPEQDCPPSIQIGHSVTPDLNDGILVNLAPTIPDFYQRFPRLIEIVFSDPVVQQSARERYRLYREAGHELNTHKQPMNDL